ncbi:hypothetical protein FIV42_11360 [Persicimonas caeni]|uniref:STAS/SEC14 domain-containing protein n=1 Tax=Persicimonas caeni TaxID=2292766 RepID=A0A4Y6PTG6_PERCE|nr:hypothetical protein [Persicimonas caeni]QDG51317.1 hypothetical protein FIV42_11360 [Persicimonas caeni]QED32538.1 hypothetical protein FRD00_11355 [Persicimonas caeni]
MYQIERTPYGYKLTFAGKIDAPEMAQWAQEARQKLKSSPDEFGVVVDMAELAPLKPDAQQEMVGGQAAFREHGMVRSAVIVKDAVVKMQFLRLARESGIYKWERYIDASRHDDPESVARAWVVDEVDPDAALSA